MAAAADLAAAEQDLTSSFHEAYPLDEVRFVFAASGALAQQIANGAPYDLFLSANVAFVDQLAASGKIVPASVQVYAAGRVGVLWRDGSTHPWSDLASPGVRFVALPNPKLAPYGLAAEQALQRDGRWDSLRSKIVFGENVRQALQLFDSGNADVVFTAYSLIAGRPGVALVPAGWHQPIRQKAGIVAASRQHGAAAEFLTFLLGPAGGRILQQHGLSPAK